MDELIITNEGIQDNLYDIPCPTCKGKGRIPDNSISTTMSYYNPSTGDSWPHIICPTCKGGKTIKVPLSELNKK